MKPEEYALIGVVIGAVIAGVLSWISSYSTSRRDERAERRKMNLELCTQFLTTIDTDIRNLNEFEEHNGSMPAGQGQEFSSRAQHDLTALELRCPRAVFKAAQALLTAIHTWADGPTTWTDLESARKNFIRTVQTRL